MEKTSDTIINELFDSLDIKPPFVPDSDSISNHSITESIKKHKRDDKSKKHKKHKKKSKKHKKKKHYSRSNSHDDYIELKLKKDKLEEAKSGIPVTLDMVMKRIVTTANEKSEEINGDERDMNENSNKDKTLTDKSKVERTEIDINQTKFSVAGLKNVKIIIKNLKESHLYHELIDNNQEKERLNTEKYGTREHDCSTHNLVKKKKSEKHKSKKKKRSRSRNRSITPKRRKIHKRSHSHRNRCSRYDDFKSCKSNSRDRSDSNTKCRNRNSDSRSKENSNHHKRSITPIKDLKLIKRSRSRDSKIPKKSIGYDRNNKQSTSKETFNNKTKHISLSCEKIDKKKLFKIARKNALSLVQQGVLPVGSVKKDTLANIPTKTVDELTDFCRKLSKRDKDQNNDTSFSSSDEEFKQPFHHPFLVKERPNIVMNIRNATQLPTKSFQEKTIGQDILRQQFPVSSGQIHSLALTEWVPLGPEESAKLNKIPRPDESNKLANKLQILPASKVPVEPVQSVSSSNSAVVPMKYQYVTPSVEPSAFVNSYTHSSFSLLSYETGQFTGHTGAKILTPAELSAGYQPWVKKDQLKNTAPVNSGIGIHLLQKMGWKPGEGLGKNQSGSLEPLLLDVKVDKRGLITEEELQGNRSKRFSKKMAPTVLSLEGKHPVSLLNEFCAKRKWDIPKFKTLDESGPSHRKTFIITVVVNGVQYCSSRCQTKKLAKMEAAKTCLKEIGLLN